jgi:tetratricopeptide (TPR) repeat protein
LFSILFVSISFAQSSNLQQGDSYYALRAENASGNIENDKNAKEAIKYYSLALKDSGAREEAAWKLLRAYYFLGCFTMPNPKDRTVFFARTKKEGKSFYEEFPKNTNIAYWYSVNLALWVREVNPFTALNAGSVKESREVAKMLIAREATDKAAAAKGHQILGRAHQKIPRIAFVLNWVKKDSAEFHLEKSMILNPEDWATRIFLAEYYKEKGREKDAETLLLPIIKLKPRDGRFLEDERDLIKMKKLLK